MTGLVATIDAWSVDFEGKNHELLVECLRSMNRGRNEEERKKGRLYRNFTSIVQSSGMGKSRTVDEASKIVFTLPFNIRDSKENGTSLSKSFVSFILSSLAAHYPPPDSNVRNVLHEQTRLFSYNQCRIYYLQFFRFVFSAVKEKLKDMGTFKNLEALACAWRELVYDAKQATRLEFYTLAIGNAVSVFFL